MNNPSKLNSWKKIKNYSKVISKTSIHKMFRDDKNRFNNFSLELDNLLLDISINNSKANAALAAGQPKVSIVNTSTSSFAKGELNQISPNTSNTSSNFSNTSS